MATLKQRRVDCACAVFLLRSFFRRSRRSVFSFGDSTGRRRIIVAVVVVQCWIGLRGDLPIWYGMVWYGREGQAQQQEQQHKQNDVHAPTVEKRECDKARHFRIWNDSWLTPKRDLEVSCQKWESKKRDNTLSPIFTMIIVARCCFWCQQTVQKTTPPKPFCIANPFLAVRAVPKTPPLILRRLLLHCPVDCTSITTWKAKKIACLLTWLKPWQHSTLELASSVSPTSWLSLNKRPLKSTVRYVAAKDYWTFRVVATNDSVPSHI